MSEQLNKVKDRIRKLLEVAKDDAATEGEISNALDFARRMMDAHHLAESDLVTEPCEQYADIETAPKDCKYSYVGAKAYYWETSLATFVSKFVGGVGVYIDNGVSICRNDLGIVQRDYKGRIKQGKRMVWYGIAEDTAIAAELYDELRTTIATMATLKFGGCYKGDGGSYSQGFVSGLYSKLQEQAKIERSTASTSTALILLERRGDLILRKEKAAKNWLASEHGVKLSRSYRSGGANGSHSAYSEGRADGQSSNVRSERRAKIC